MSSSLKFLPRSDFHNALINAKASATDKWDVVVSYSQEKLQPLLAQYWAKAIRPTTITRKHSTGDDDYDRCTTYTLHLGPPQFVFDKKPIDGGSIAMAKISWTLTGTAHTVLNDGTDKGVKQLTAADGFSLTAHTPIHAIRSGSELSGRPKTSNDPIEFTDGSTASYKVTIQLTATTDTTWDVNYKEPKPDPVPEKTNPAKKTDPTKKEDKLKPAKKNTHAKDLKKEAADLGAELNKMEYFSFTLCEVKNSPNPKDYVLTPKLFRFSADRGVLSIFINVKGGDGKGAAQTPQFKLAHDDDIAPMPEGFDASIILSKDLIRDKYLIPKIQERCRLFLKDTGGVTAHDALGPAVALKFSNSKVWSGLKSGNHNMGGPLITEGRIDVDWDKYPLILTLSDDASKLESRYEWSWDNAVVTLTYWEKSNKGGTSRDRTKSLTANLSENSSPIATVSGKDELAFKISFTDSNQPSATFNDIGANNLSGSVKFMTFDVSLPDINFFRTQNVLAPGEHFFTPKNTMCPCDLFVLGSVEGH